MDGSSKYFVEALEKAGIKKLNKKRKEYVVNKVISFKEKHEWTLETKYNIGKKKLD